MAILKDLTELNLDKHLTVQMVNQIAETAIKAYELAKTATENIQKFNEAIGQALNTEV